MKLWDFIAGKLPSSKKQVRLADEANYRMHQELLGEIAGLSERLDRIEGLADNNRSDVVEQGAHNELMLWQLLRRDGESFDETRRRFFLEMPPARGLPRVIQLGNAQLLQDFDELCSMNGLSYWCLSGTLLGAWRHRGFIPWDDDVDLGMMRGDVSRLAEIVKDSPFELVESFSPRVLCRQVRIMYANEDNPCFVDLFIHDWSSNAPEEAYDARCKAREEALKRYHHGDGSLHDEVWQMRKIWNPFERRHEGRELLGVFDEVLAESEFASFAHMGAPAGANPAADIDAVAGANVAAEVNHNADTDPTAGEGASVTDSGTAEARSIVWALDNIGERFKTAAAFERDRIFPCSRLSFEGFEVCAPSKAEEVLHIIYQDIYRLPSDITRHFRHIDEKAFEREVTLKAIQQTLNPQRLDEFDAVLFDQGMRNGVAR